MGAEGGVAAIGPQPDRQDPYSWEYTETLLKVLKYYTYTHTHIPLLKRLMPGLMEASRILLQHKSNTDWVASTLTSCTYNEYLPYLEAGTIQPHHIPPLPTSNVALLPKMTSCLNQRKIS